jgi:5,10-methylenetetrahydrofolate reductase
MRLPLQRLPRTSNRLENPFGEDDAAATVYGIEYASKQCVELLKEGAPGIHFYILTKRDPRHA